MAKAKPVVVVHDGRADWRHGKIRAYVDSRSSPEWIPVRSDVTSEDVEELMLEHGLEYGDQGEVIDPLARRVGW